MEGKNQLILVNEKDEQVGIADKTTAHLQGMLHRAFSIFLFNSNNELLLQQRALHKYHTPGLWTNTCCSHPYDGEVIEDAALKRLEVEMGISASLEKVFHFQYKSVLPNGLIEHELDHVFIGKFSDKPNINPDEAMAWKYMPLDAIETEIEKTPEKYTPWFKIILPKLKAYM